MVHAVLVGKLGAVSGSSWPCKGRMLEWAMVSGKGIGQPFCPGHTDLFHGGLQRVWVHRAGVSPQERHGRGSKETVPTQPLPPPMLTMVGPPELRPQLAGHRGAGSSSLEMISGKGCRLHSPCKEGPGGKLRLEGQNGVLPPQPLFPTASWVLALKLTLSQIRLTLPCSPVATWVSLPGGHPGPSTSLPTLLQSSPEQSSQSLGTG